MIFLIDYEPKTGLRREFKTFPDSERAEAQRQRLEIELGLNGERESREVVLLEAADEQALRRTHQRYFQTAEEIVDSMFAFGVYQFLNTAISKSSWTQSDPARRCATGAVSMSLQDRDACSTISCDFPK